MRERVKGGGARAPPWARAALVTCVRERRAAAQHGAFGAEPVPGERRSALRRGAFNSGTCEGGGVWVFESRWHSSQRGRCVTWGRRRAAGGDTDRARRLLMCCVCCARVWRGCHVCRSRGGCPRNESSVEPNVAGLRTQLRTECSAPECSEVIFSKVGVALTFTRVIARLPDHTRPPTRAGGSRGRVVPLRLTTCRSSPRSVHAIMHSYMQSCTAAVHVRNEGT